MRSTITQNLPIKIGIVGCGRIAQKHIEAIKALPKMYKLVSICDVDHTAIEAVSALFPSDELGHYTTLAEMLKKETIDLLSICTPSGLHADQAITAAKHNVTTLCEKPMATLFEDGLRIVESFDQSDANIYIVKQNRLNPTLQKVKRAMLDGRFGKIALVTANVFWTRPQSYYDSGSGWRGTWEFDGGAVMNQASHYVDLLQWLIGPVEEVHAYSTTTRQIETEDTSVVSLKWRNGAIGSMNVTMRTFPQNLEGSITILGDYGSVSLGGIALNEMKNWIFKDTKNEDKDFFENNYETSSVYGHGHLEYYRLLSQQIFNAAGPLPCGREGLKSLEILSAIYKSARDNRAVGLPLRV